MQQTFIVLVWVRTTLTTFCAKTNIYLRFVKVMPEILLVPFFRTRCIFYAKNIYITWFHRPQKAPNMFMVN